MAATYRDDRVGDFLDQVATRSPAPGGGAVAALTASLAASLVAMAARYSTGLLEAGEHLVAQADRLRDRAAGLADADAEAYGAVISAYDRTRDDDTTDRADVHGALTRATEVPLEIAEVGAETARLAATLVHAGKHDVRGDANTALLLAEAATRSAAHLVAVNVAAGGGDESHARRAAECVASAGEAAGRAQTR